MGIMQVSLIVLLIGLSVVSTKGATIGNTCPPREQIPGCKCISDYSSKFDVRCEDWHSKMSFEDIVEMLHRQFDKDQSLKLKFANFDKESTLPSKAFDGLNIRSLKIRHSNITRWADEEGGPAFVGLEDTLETLAFEYTIRRDFDSDKRKEYKAPMSLGHLRKLREVEFLWDDIYTLGNDWFGKGGKSVERIMAKKCGIHVIGDEAFASFSNLRKVDLFGNHITALSRSMFPNPALHLEELFLIENNIQTLSEDMFINMPSLRVIRLEQNYNLLHIPEKTWRPVWSRLTRLTFDVHSLVCDSRVDWVFEVPPPKVLTAGCHYPYELRGKRLIDLIKEKKEKELQEW